MRAGAWQGPLRTFVQIEITTHCNYQCFYCAGRDMPQQHMAPALFAQILDRLPPTRLEVSLQGEGEPTTHPQFWPMVEEVRRRGYVPYTITNANVLDVEKAAALLPRIGISLDTLDPAEAERIGRYKLARTLANVDALLRAYDPACLIVHTVDYGQDLSALRAYLRQRNVTNHYVQPLQTKADYAYRYRERVPEVAAPTHYRCRYLEQRRLRYFTIEGIEMPCCFIKDVRTFESAAAIRATLARRQVPTCCVGCRELV